PLGRRRLRTVAATEPEGPGQVPDQLLELGLAGLGVVEATLDGGVGDLAAQRLDPDAVPRAGGAIDRRSGVAQPAAVDPGCDALDGVDQVQGVALPSRRPQQLGEVAQTLAVGHADARAAAGRRPSLP